MAAQDSTYPDPDQALDLAEFIAALGKLRMAAGAVSYRRLAKLAGPLLRPPQELSTSTVADVFKPDRRRLDLDLVMAIVRALGVEGPAADRWLQACVRVHGAAKAGGPVGVFRQLPADLATFTGRREELARLIEAAVPSADRDSANTVVVFAIEGMAGVGKTQLAVHAAHELIRAGHYTDLQLYVNLRGFDPEQPPVDPSAVLDAFLRQLGVAADHIPPGRDERAAMFRDRMHGRDALVLLDNAADEEQVRDLIPAGPGCLVLVTSRRSLAALDGARLLRLDTFSRREAVALLARLAGKGRVAEEPEAAERVVEICGCLPLAVSLAGARLRGRSAWSLTDLATRLHAGGLDEIRVGGRSLRPVFDMSFQGLTEPAKAVLRAFGVHPGSDLTVAAAAAAAGLSAEQTEQELETLLDEHLVRERTPGRYEVHDLIRAFASEMATEAGPDARSASLDRLATWYLRSAWNAATAIDTRRLPEVAMTGDDEPAEFHSYYSAIVWYDTERDNICAVHTAAAAADLYDVVWRLPIVCKQFMALRCHRQDYLTSHSAAVRLARAREDGAVLPLLLGGVATALRDLGRLDEAEKALAEALAVCQARGDEENVGRALSDLAVVRDRLGRHDEAIADWQQAIAIAEKHGYQRGAVLGRLSLAVAYHGLGRPDTSAGYCREALAGAREIGDRRAECFALGHTGRLHLDRGEFDQALAVYTEHERLSLALADREQNGTGIEGLGDALHGLGRPAEAFEKWAVALAVYEEIGSPTAERVRATMAATATGF